MEKFIEITKIYVKQRSTEVAKNWRHFSISGLYNPFNPEKRLNALNDLLSINSKFSIKMTAWLQDEIRENSLNIDDIRNWITHLKTNIIKVKTRIHYLLVCGALLLFFISILQNFPMSLYYYIEIFGGLVVVLVIIAGERVVNSGFQDCLNELIIYLEREIESMEANKS